jgi:hypothetical protein
LRATTSGSVGKTDKGDDEDSLDVWLAARTEEEVENGAICDEIRCSRRAGADDIARGEPEDDTTDEEIEERAN